MYDIIQVVNTGISIIITKNKIIPDFSIKECLLYFIFIFEIKWYWIIKYIIQNYQHVALSYISFRAQDLFLSHRVNDEASSNYWRIK